MGVANNGGGGQEASSLRIPPPLAGDLMGFLVAAKGAPDLPLGGGGMFSAAPPPLAGDLMALCGLGG